jgi:hypothetical protein
MAEYGLTPLPDERSPRPSDLQPYNRLSPKDLQNATHRLKTLEHKGMLVEPWIRVIEERMTMHPFLYWYWNVMLMTYLDDVLRSSLEAAFDGSLMRVRWQLVARFLRKRLGTTQKMCTRLTDYETSVPMVPGERLQTFVNRVDECFSTLPDLGDQLKIYTFSRWMHAVPWAVKLWGEVYDDAVHTKWNQVSLLVIPTMIQRDHSFVQASSQRNPAGQRDGRGATQSGHRDSRSTERAGARRDGDIGAGTVRVNVLSLDDCQAQGHDVERPSSGCPFCRIKVPTVFPGKGGDNRFHFLRNCKFFDHPHLAREKEEFKANSSKRPATNSRPQSGRY